MESPQKREQEDSLGGLGEGTEGTKREGAQDSAEAETKQRRSRLKPTVPLPSGRLNVDKELAMLRAYVSQSKSGERAVHFSDIAGLVQTHETSVSASKEFWGEIGLLERTSRGEHKPTPDLVAWALKADFDSGEASASLRRAFDQAWFGDTIRSALQVHRSLKKDVLAKILANTAGGEKDDTEPRARLLVELLVATDYLVESEAGDVSIAAESATVPPQVLSDPSRTLAKQSAGWTGESAIPINISTETVRTVGDPRLGLSLEIAVSNWSVDDVIRLLKYMRTGDDERRKDTNLQNPQP